LIFALIPSTGTDTLSLSSTDHKETERAVQNQSVRASNGFSIDADKAKQLQYVCMCFSSWLICPCNYSLPLFY